MGTRRATGESSVLLVGSAVNGVFAYVFVAIGTRAVGAEGFAPVAVLWTFWALSAAVLTFPLQHWVIRQMAIDGDAGGVRAALPRILGWVAGVVGALTVIAAVFRAELFGAEASWVWPALVAGTAAGSGYLGMVRGLLAGAGRYGPAAAVIGGENVVRVAAAVIAATVSADAAAFGMALLAGPIAGVFRPSVLPGAPPATPPDRALLGSAGIGLLLAQIVLNGGPPLLAALGGSEAEVTAFFAALALFRAPYLLALGLTVRVTAPLTRLVEDRRFEVLGRITRLGAAATVAAAAAAAGVGWAVGPAVIRVLFGEGTDPSAAVTAAVAAGCTLALGALGLTVALIARAASVALSASWAASVAGGGIVLVIASGWPAVERVVLAFVAAEAVAVAAMTFAGERWLRAMR